jgi:hypothetical protein
VADDCENRGIGDEFLGDLGCSRSACLVVARDNLELRAMNAASTIDLIDREIDSAVTHHTVALFPRPGSAYRI